jgi:hypothetical protein
LLKERAATADSQRHIFTDAELQSILDSVHSTLNAAPSDAEQAAIAEGLRDLRAAAFAAHSRQWEKLEKIEEGICDRLLKSEKNTAGKFSEPFVQALRLKIPRLPIDGGLVKGTGTFYAAFPNLKKFPNKDWQDLFERLLKEDPEQLLKMDTLRALYLVETAERQFGVSLEEWQAKEKLLRWLSENLPSRYDGALTLAKKLADDAQERVRERRTGSILSNIRCFFERLRLPKK